MIKRRAVVFSAGFVLLLVLTNEGILIYSNRVFKETSAIQAEATEVKNLTETIWDGVVRNVDLGVRGYALTKDEKLLIPFNDGKRSYNDLIKNLTIKLTDQNFPDKEELNQMKAAYTEYLGFMDHMAMLVTIDSMNMFQEELKKDKGLILWRAYEKFSKKVGVFEDARASVAAQRYKTANLEMSIIQILLGIIGTPTLIFMIYWFVRDEKKRMNLFLELEKNNRKYVFDPGKAVEINDEREVINNSIFNFQKAAAFISQISSGNFNVAWDDMDEKNKELNKNNLAGELIHMREKMKELKQDDAKRIWATEGIADFSQIIRTHQNDLKKMSEEAVSFIVKYLKAQQGALFILQENDNERYLELLSCYAFNKKKFMEKRIEIGQGLIGQVYLEKQIVKMTEIPQGYTFITSGLGETTPDTLLIIPMIYNEKVEAVMEIAGFENYEKHQMDWLMKIGEILASSLISLKTTERTSKLLEQFKEQTEEMRAQEEELRQNMEELEATQEEMRRKEQELERRYKELEGKV
jgi:CHASE3 domain sensor protein